MSNTFSGVSMIATIVMGSKKPPTNQNKTPQKNPMINTADGTHLAAVQLTRVVFFACLLLAIAWELVRYLWTNPPPNFHGQVLLDSSGKDYIAVKPQLPELATVDCSSLSPSLTQHH